MDFKYPCGCSFDIFVYYNIYDKTDFIIERVEDDGASFELCEFHKAEIKKQHDLWNIVWNENMKKYANP